MNAFTSKNPDFEQAVRASFARQGAMGLLGAELATVEPGHVEIALRFRPALSQQNGYFHAGITTTIADSAAGYAAYSLFAPGHEVLTVEFKVNLLAPADGERLLAIGAVKKPGRTLTICEFEVIAFKGEKRTTCAFGIATMFCLPARAA
jgi:uncharacterized protein (TIGR00369 family)